MQKLFCSKKNKNRQRLKKSAQLELPSNSTELTLWGSRSPPGAPPACWSRGRALWAAWAPWWRPGDAGWTTWQGPTRSCSPPCTWRTPWEGPAKRKVGKGYFEQWSTEVYLTKKTKRSFKWIESSRKIQRHFVAIIVLKNNIFRPFYNTWSDHFWERIFFPLQLKPIPLPKENKCMWWVLIAQYLHNILLKLFLSSLQDSRLK